MTSNTQSTDPQSTPSSASNRKPDVTQAPTGERVDQSAEHAPSSADDGANKSTREQKVREAAYRRFEERGGTHGHHDKDWQEAEEEVDRSSSK